MPYKILCVDDEPLTLRTIACMLGDEYQVDTASAGVEAIDAIHRCGPYAAVLSDFYMPNMNGAAFLKKVYQLAPATSRLLLTGCQAPDLVIRTITEGRTCRLLAKPCSVAVLCAALKDAVKEYEAALLGRPPKAPPRINAAEIASPAALAVASAIESIFESMLPDRPSECKA